MKRKLLTVLLALVAALCLCLGLAACGRSNEDDGHEHVYTVENKCSICGKEWEYTKSDALEYTKVVLDGVEGYDVRFGVFLTVNVTYDSQGFPTNIEQIPIGKELEGEEVVFPYGYNGLPVISIGRFYPCMSDTVKHITVPKSILSFGQSITYQNGTRGAFHCTALEKLDLPDGLPVLTRQEISADNEATVNTAFPLCYNTLFYDGGVGGESCPLYEDPQYRENGALYIGNYLFEADFDEPVENYTVKDGTKVVISLRGAKHVVLPDSVEIIAQGAFRNSSLESIEVGSGIEEIGGYVFNWSNLTSITLPDKPISIGQGAFMQTPFFENKENWEYLGEKSADNYTSSLLCIGNHLIYFACSAFTPSFEMKPNLKSIAGDAFEYSTVGELHIPDIETWFNIRRGGSNATPRAQKLIIDGQETAAITIPSSVTEIPDYAFARMESLTSVTLHDGVTKIGDGAFLSCENLTGITIPSGVTKIGTNAFGNCYKLASINVSEANPNYASENGILYNKAKNHIVTVPTGLTGAVVLPNSLTSIEYFAFYNCYGITSIEIPAGVTSINAYWLNGCTALASISVGANNPNYSSQDGILYNKDKTKIVCIPPSVTGAITIPDSLTSIDSGTFGNCTKLTSITVGANNPNYSSQDGILYNKDKTEIVCVPRAITGAVTIPDSITTIDSWTFSNCTKLTSISVGANHPNYSSQDGILYNKDKTEIVYVPLAITGTVTIPDTVTRIDYEFNNCYGITSIEIPASVTSIYGTFSGCSALTGFTVDANNPNYSSQDGILYNKNKTEILRVPPTVTGTVTIPDGVTSINYGAFENCTGITSLIIPNSVTSINYAPFEDSKNLTDIQFKGTVEEWQAMDKNVYWDNGLGDYTITCTNGKIAKDGTVTMN